MEKTNLVHIVRTRSGIPEAIFTYSDTETGRIEMESKFAELVFQHDASFTTKEVKGMISSGYWDSGYGSGSVSLWIMES